MWSRKLYLQNWASWELSSSLNISLMRCTCDAVVAHESVEVTIRSAARLLLSLTLFIVKGIVLPWTLSLSRSWSVHSVTLLHWLSTATVVICLSADLRVLVTMGKAINFLLYCLYCLSIYRLCVREWVCGDVWCIFGIILYFCTLGSGVDHWDS